MTLQAPSHPAPEESHSTGTSLPALAAPRTPWLLWASICLLMATAQIAFAGYQLGVGNQTIQIPFLKYYMNPLLYSRDVMVQTTIKDYPSFFYRGLAWVCPLLGGVEKSFFFFQVLTTFGVFLAVFGLARAMFANSWAGLVALLLLVAGHHQALAGDDLYSPGFTHTWAVFPLCILALALFYRRHPTWALLIAGLLFNLHALSAAYLAFIMGCAAILEPVLTAPKSATFVQRFFILPARASLPGLFLFILLAFPTLWQMLAYHQVYPAQWFELTHVRSADHSFPASWWQSGDADLPRFALWIGLAAIALSFTPAGAARRKTLLLIAATLWLFLIGTLFTQVWPLATVVRAQLFRSSRLLLIILLCQIAWGIVCGIAVALQPGALRLRLWQRMLELLAALAIFCIVAIPPLLPLLPYAFALALLVALLNGRLSMGQSFAGALVLLVCMIAAQDIQFAIPGLTTSWTFTGAAAANARLFWPALATAAGLGLLACLLKLNRWPAALLALPVAGLAIALATHLYAQDVSAPSATADPFRDVQEWARKSSPLNALFLTPTQPGGFRIFSERSVVAEWRDGTQLYFTADFASTWWDRITALQPGLELADDKRRLLLRGKSLDSLNDGELITLAGNYHASHVLLPREKATKLVPLYQNSQWAVYLPRFSPPPAPPPVEHPVIVPKEALDKDRWLAQEKFMDKVVLPNIEKYRKSEVQIHIVDAAGMPVDDLNWEANETRQAFNFSASLPFFKVPAAPSTMDFKPRQPVDPREPERLLEVFNSSLIPFSAKWMYIEPEENKFDYEDLDIYLNWAKKHDIPTEWHFITGYPPLWVLEKDARGQRAALLKHARDVMTRYGDEIAWWQVSNEHLYQQFSADLFRAIREVKPDAKLGLAYCEMFWVPGSDAYRQAQLTDGLAEIRQLKAQGIKVDFYATHGHRPFGLWADPATIYAAFDTFAKEGVKIHITEFFEPLPGDVIGPLRGGQWTPELQADYYVRMFQIAYSHPAVELINIWGIGPQTWQNGSGLLDAKYQPKPAFTALKDLIQNQLKTRASGTLAANGLIEFRAFHGDYELLITNPAGKTLRTSFHVAPPASADLATSKMPADNGVVQITFRLDAAKGTLERL